MASNNQRQPWQDRWGKSIGEVFRELLQERGIAKYADVYSVTDGKELPSGLESHGFWILTSDGKLWDYTIEWDADKLNPDGEKGYYMLSEPRDATGEWDDRPYYIRARKQLNLPLTEEQERILQEWEAEQKKRQLFRMQQLNSTKGSQEPQGQY